ncbi:MAG: HesA/MoeB/ThiF family protein [Anaerolineae bacterium]|nr:HesA/MoeB/ThiF family protein [Anaerolineae bacterium]
MEMNKLIEDMKAMAFEESGVQVLGVDSIETIARKWGLKLKDVEIAALEAGFMPRRYLRNLGTVGFEGQRKLLQSKVAVIGLGGLGGHVCVSLARMGVGTLVVADGDVFVDHNLNRQVLSDVSVLGEPKAEIARRVIARVNPAVEVIAWKEFIQAENLDRILEGCQVVVDGLDSLPARLKLEEAARKAGIPLVHGAIAGFLGQVITIFPEDPGLKALYGDRPPDKGIEVELGTPAATPMMVAAVQVQEVIKILLGKGRPLRRRLLLADAESWSIEIVEL